MNPRRSPANAISGAHKLRRTVTAIAKTCQAAWGLHVRDHAPERALEIWQTLALRQINQTTPAAYQVAGRHLRKVKQTMTKVGQTEEWCRYLATLREAHRRKRRLLGVLDGLE